MMNHMTPAAVNTSWAYRVVEMDANGDLASTDRAKLRELEAAVAAADEMASTIPIGHLIVVITRRGYRHIYRARGTHKAQ